MKVLVTGANSLVGSHLVRELIRDKHHVRAFVRSSSDVRSLEGLDIDIVTGNVLDQESLVSAAKGCQVMFHAAAIFSYYGHKPGEIMKIATEGTINAVEAAKRSKVKRMVLTSSSVVMGSSEKPVVLDEMRAMAEGEPNEYIKSKVEQEAIAFRRSEELGVDLVSVYPTLCIGAHDYRLSESNALIINYLNDPFRSTWQGGGNLVAAEDVARGHILVALHGRTREKYTLGSDNLNWREIHRMISEICGQQGPLMTAYHTTSFLAGAYLEFISQFTKQRPLVTRAQAAMIGRYYWYSSEKAKSLGYSPMSSRRALVKAISWLVTSQHVPASLRNTITLSSEVYMERNKDD